MRSHLPLLRELLALTLQVLSSRGIADTDTLLYPYGPQYQDRSTPKADDGASPQISITEDFYFYGKRYHSLYVNNNGVVSFGQPVSQFTPDPFPLTDGEAFVAPFWADVDNRITGEVYYRQTQDEQLLQRATADINAYFPRERFAATWVFVATWDQVAFYGSLSSKVNTFQAVLTSNGRRSFVLLNYKDIQWISGQASGGDTNTGLEGTPAQAGFNKGDAEHYFNIPGSWTPHIINITSTSNILDPGRWVFEVDVFVVPNGCVYKANFLPVNAIFWVDPTCEKKCQCLPDGYRVRCQAEKCSVDEICRATFQHHICQPIHRASCQVLGGRHYTTFDGRLYHFRGNCTYVLSQMCVPSRNLEYYRVEVEMPGASRIRCLRMTVYEQEIVIPANATGHVMIRGMKALLPVTLLGGKVRVRQSGFSIKVVTDWGMEVSYDGKQNVVVTVPITYHNATCGLCGTLNGNVSDDFSMPNASLVTSVVQFATSWEAKGYQCGEISELLTCPPSEQANYSRPEYCGFLNTSPGPFAACAQILPPTGYVESCVSDLCESGGDRTVLCEILAVYTERCQAAKVVVGEWRSEGFCGVACPENSHFESCSTACPASCLDSTAPLFCPEPCREGCPCHRDYLLSGGTCVPRNQCGCSLDGQYYRVGDEVILTSNCSKKCSCRHPSHPMACQDHACGALEECRVVEGVLGCHPKKHGHAWVFGDPHYVTFDGLSFDYDGACKYVLSKYCGPPGQLTDFAIKVENEHRGSVEASWTRLVELEVYGELVAIAAGQYGKVQVNGILVNLPFVHPTGKFYAYFDGCSAVIQTHFGLSVSYDWSYHILVTMPVTYAGSLCGLSGNFNRNQSDDFRAPDGSLVHDAVRFGNSWKDPSSPLHCTAVRLPSPCSEAELSRYRSLSSCGVIGDPDGPFKLCGEASVARVHLENCVRDMCVTEGNQSTLCEVLKSYAQQCQIRGVAIQPWRELIGCELTCPANSRYELCGSSCPTSCAHPAMLSHCQTPCTEGCRCKPGFVLSGTNCVPSDKCGCSYDGRYYLAGESFWHGANCQRFCRCDGSTHVVECANSTCGPGELCRTQEGIHGCHAVSLRTCRASEFLHYTTFDGLRYDFQGTCKYVFAELCRASPSLHFFQVEQKNKKLPNGRLTAMSEVFVRVGGWKINLEGGRQGTIKVEGASVNLPISLNLGDTVIYQQGTLTILKTGFGLTVSYGRAHGLAVTLPPEYAGHTCGLCGNFNGAASDDAVAPDHSSSKQQVFAAGTNWKPEIIPGCFDSSSDSYPTCLEEEQLVQAKLKCWILQDPKGPFASCHRHINPEPYLSECIFDLCVSQGDHYTLCQSIEKYAAACQRSHVNISAWRSGDFCVLQCPEHSHYELCGNPTHGLCSGTWLQDVSGPTCSEGCFCDDGYLWSSHECVPPEQCGCEHDGRYYKMGDHVWLPGCAQKCICAPRGDFRCFAATCDSTQRCTLKAGRFGCHGQLTTCIVTGDPHYFTFDGAVVHFQGICDYEVAHTVNSSLGFSFRVVAANRHFRNPRVSFVYRVEIWLWTSRSSAHVVLERGKAAHVNGRRTQLPAQVGSIAEILRQRNMLTVKTKANVEIQFNGASSLFIRVGPEYQTQLGGLCGNFNGDPTDDKVLPSGAPALNDAEFGNAWISKSSPAGCRNDTTDLIPCPRREEFQRLCAILLDSSGPFSECHWHENPEPFYKACVYDLCQYGLGNRMLCGAVEAYDEMCAIVGLKVSNWRRAMGCSFICPANNYYDFCGTACPASCAKLNAPAHCTKPCVAGCFCREGYVLNAGVCVPLSRCGCMLSGHYYPLGAEVIVTDTCSKKCACRHPARSMECQEHACGPLELCKVVDERRGCYHMSFGTMWANGHSLYITYDGAVFDHPGACRYTLTKYCGPPGKLPGFTVKVQNAHNSSIAVTWLKWVELSVYGQHILMAAGQYGKIQVNGLQINLPLLLVSGKVQAYSSGSAVIVQTDFGLVVSYHWSYVSVSVPETYSGSLCGLGGDFNGNPHDDFRIPNGSLVHDTVAFGHSWKDPQSAFHCVAVNLADTCSKAELAQYTSQVSCGVISDANGPLKGCYSPAAAHMHVEACVRDMCRNQGSQKTLCEVLTSYAQWCQARGIDIQPWRAIVGCELTCPLHSQYVLCGSSCPASCAQPNGPKSCQPACLEGCQCEPGFVLSGADCVPPEQCGCSSQGRYYLKGEMFFREGEKCEKMYLCNGSISAIDAVGPLCGSGHTCGLYKGVYGCYLQPDAICWVSGFLHYTTFDGGQYSFQSMPRYVLVEQCGESKSGPSFRVEVKTEKLPKRPLSLISEVISEVFVMVDNTQIHLQRGHQGTVKIDGAKANLPVRIGRIGATVFERGFYVVVKMDFGLTVSYDLAHSLLIALSPQYQGQTCGLCGNLTRVYGDELGVPKGTPVKVALGFVKALGTSMDPGEPDKSIISIFTFLDARLLPFKSMCWIIHNPDGPFASCHAQVDPEPFLTDCIADLYIADGDRDILCRSVQTYVAACQIAKVTLLPWRQETFCSAKCPANSHYELCGSPCQDLCSRSSTESHCGRTCFEGCFCNRGYLRSGGVCIPEERCGCRHQGHFYKIGDRVWLTGCQERCSCEGPSDFRCTPAACKSGQQCIVKDGKLGCHGQLTTCTVTGDPHYFTFDGAVAHFQGTCAYEVSRTCHGPSPFSFRVVAENRNHGNPRVSFVSRVDVWMESENLNFHIAIKDGQIVEVNQHRVQLPHALGSLGNITRIQNMVTVKSAADVEIQYNGHHTLFIHVGPQYQGKLCGMCGNFNGIRGDDKTLPDGTRAHDDSQFGNAWKAEPSPAGCSDDPATLQPCPDPQEFEELCGPLIHPSGPFAECHWHVDPAPFYSACLYDLCHYGTAHGMLCLAFGAYEEFCLFHGVQAGGWRAAAQCAARDPCADLACGENEWCGEKNGKWGCFCRQDYGPAAVADYDYRLTCASSTHSAISLSRCLLFADGFPPEGLHLVDPVCAGTLVGDRLIFYFDAVKKTCGTTAEVNGTHAVYSNMVQGHVEKTYGGVISRDQFLFLSFSCAYPLNVNLSMSSAIHPIQDVINATLTTGQGSYQTFVTLYRDPQYSRPFVRRPVLLPVNHRVYVGIRVLGADPTQFVVTLSSCWATPVRDPSSSIRWDLITNQCPNTQDGTVLVEEDGVSLVGRFSFDVFMFIPDLEKVYLHCRIRLCSFLTAKCTMNCEQPGPALGRRPPLGIVTTGPFLRYDGSLDPAKRTPSGSTAR